MKQAGSRQYSFMYSIQPYSSLFYIYPPLSCHRWLQSVRLRCVMARNSHPGCRQSWLDWGRSCRIRLLRKKHWGSRWLTGKRNTERPLFVPNRRLASSWVRGHPHYNHWDSFFTPYCSQCSLFSFIWLSNLTNSCPGTKDQLQNENDELKQQREELEVRVSALKSQYEGRLSRQERELRDLRGQQERQEQRDEPPEAGPSKVRVCFKSFLQTL